MTGKTVILKKLFSSVLTCASLSIAVITSIMSKFPVSTCLALY
jgi:hypothetical protein